MSTSSDMGERETLERAGRRRHDIYVPRLRLHNVRLLVRVQVVCEIWVLVDVARGDQRRERWIRVCPVVRLRAWNLPSTEATSTISSDSECASGSGACLVGPDGVFLFQCRAGSRKFTISGKHDETRRRVSTTAVRECKCVVWDAFGVCTRAFVTSTKAKRKGMEKTVSCSIELFVLKRLEEIYTSPSR
jgi:hypothetical protein